MNQSIEEIYKEATEHIHGPLHDYWLNHAFVRGLQWLQWNNNLTRLIETNASDDRIQATFNKIRANQRTVMANLTQRKLSFEIPPTGPDDESVRASRLGEAILRDLHRHDRWEVVREEHMAATCKGGTGALIVEIDPEDRHPVVKPLSIAEFVVEPGSRNAETARWMIKVEALPPKVVQAIFGLGKEPPADANAGLAVFQHRLLTQSFGTGVGVTPKLTRVLTYYERPINGSKGGWKVWIDGKVVKSGKWPYPFTHRLPIAVARETVEENQWFGSTYLNDVRKIQIILNAIWSAIAENAKQFGATKLFYPASAADFAEEMDDRPGLQPWPDGVELPSYLEQPQLRNWFEQIIDRAGYMIDDIMGVHDISRGQAPPNIESGFGISILAEKDASPTNRLIKEEARCWEDMAQMCLQIYQVEYRNTTRTITVDSGFGPERFEHTGADLSEEFDVYVPEDAIQPRSRVGMIAQADKMFQLGMIQTPAQYVRVAELPGSEDILAGISPQLHKARRENAAMARGKITDPDFHKNDDHDLHIEEHRAFMSTERWEMLPAELRSIFDDHVQMHENFKAEARAKEIRMAGAEANAEAAVAPADPMMAGGEMPPEMMGGEMMGIDPAMMDPMMMGGGMDPMMPAEPADLLDIDRIDIDRQLAELTGEA